MDCPRAMLHPGLAKIKSMQRVDAFGNSPGVCRKLAEGIGSLLGWRKGVRQKKIETRQKIIGVAEKLVGSRNGLTMARSMKLQPDDGPRYSLGIGPSTDDAVGSHRKFARRFAEGIEKLTGNAKGDRQKEDRRTCHKIVGGYQSMQEAARELDYFNAHIRLREPGKSNDKAEQANVDIKEAKENRISMSPATRWRRSCMRVIVCLSIDQGELLKGHSGVEAGGRKGRESNDESSGAQLPKSKVLVRKEVDSEEHHSAVEVDLPIAQEGMQMQDNK
ncbi:hypothetical protein B296_00017316 [Ensete ventricosum]|uniref:Uncharacterized protein n=1 Tax=Ensete ventricosum TaxID=4639 RepID=A0A426X6S7_ENSVE|nr:hypothetical protein B296_00017316 [Ensete ventricosum]